MNQEEAFLQAVLETPDDDTPRLVYADWLDDHGDARGTFIRLQCEIARLPEDDPRRAALMAQAMPLEEQIRKSLRQKVRPEWARRIPAWVLKEKHNFERGFLAGLTTTPGRFLQGAEALVRAVPLQHLKLNYLREFLPKLLALPEIERLRTLDLSWSWMGNPGAAALAGASRLRGLRALTLQACQLRCGSGVSLGTSPYLANLTHLNLRGNSLYDRGVEGLVRSKEVWALTDLDVGWHNKVGPRGATALATSPRLGRLVSLSIDSNRLGERGAVTLAEGGLPTVRSLDISFNDVGDSGAVALLSSTALTSLHKLDLCSNELTTAIWRVTPSALLRGRLHLKLSKNDFAEGGPMVDSALLAACVGLELYDCNLSDTLLNALAESASLAGLRVLNLGGNLITGAGLADLVRSPHLGALRSLSMPGNRLGAGGVEALLASPLARQLTHLDLSRCQLPTINGGQLASAACLEGITELRLGGNPRLGQVRERLVERFGSRVVLE
jgi:uncharacterized protein (TIGR02996 family)